VPPPSGDEERAVAAAVARVGIELALEPASYRSAWRRAALLEGVERHPWTGGYALSPRRTRGAMRA
jgi:hypothetical protein